MAAAAEALRDRGQVRGLRRGVPGIAPHRDLGPLARAADRHAVDRGGKQVVGRELVVAFRVLVGNVEEKHAVL